MKIITSTIAVLLLCYVTNTECGIFDKIKIKIKFPGFPSPVFTITPPKFTFPKLPSPPKTTTSTTTTPKTAPPTTVPPTSTPPTTPPPPEPKTFEEMMIEECLQDMSKCEWSPEELLEKIEELQEVNKSEFAGEGLPTNPVVNPDNVPMEEEKVVIGGTSKPGTAPKVTAPKTAFPKACTPFCDKSSETRYYQIDCISYLSDTTLKWYYQRRNAMLGCLKCRSKCELAGAVHYL